MTKLKSSGGNGVDRPDRAGHSLLAAYVSVSVHQAFKILAIKEGTTSVALFHEAIALVFARHGEPVPPDALAHLKEHGRPVPEVPTPKARKNGRRPGAGS